MLLCNYAKCRFYVITTLKAANMDYKDEQYIKLNNLANDIIDTLPTFASKFFSHIKNQGM